MKKYVHIGIKVLFSLILLLPALGAVGIFPEPTRDLYNTDQAFAFIEMITKTMYIAYIMAAVHVVALVALWTGREALAALLEVPIVVNIAGFHLFLDGGLLTGGAVLADLLILIVCYLLWTNRERYAQLFAKA